ncbi:MAG: hypothetical protein FIA94_14720, partial [Nitrospirae bacterium]|nr:hypothetical protein [Nitrospirota bacterium]
MSYILDALKKAERERKRGTVPDVLSMQEGLQQPAPKRPVRTVFIIAVLSLISALLLWWSAPWKAGSQKNAVAELPVLAPQQESINPGLSPVGDEGEPPKPRMQDERARTVGQEHPALTGTPITKLPKPTSGLMPEMKPETVEYGRGPADTKKEARVKEPLPVAEPVAEIPPPENRIYRLKELPEPLKRTLPGFSISAFLYSATPTSRMVRI